MKLHPFAVFHVIHMISANRIFSTVSAFLLIFTFCGVFPENVFPKTTVVVLHTNDHHGHLAPSPSGNGGLARLETLVNRERAENTYTHSPDFGRVLLLDAGDINTGTPESDLFFGRPDILAYNRLHYDFAAFGNHEFDAPFSRLEEQLKYADFPFGSANVLKTDGTPLGTEYRVFQFPDGIVGVFGITTSDSNIMAKSDGKFKITDEIETAKKMVRFLREEKHADIIIAVTHLGLRKDMGTEITSLELADAVPGIHFIVDGHSHTKMDVPLVSPQTHTPIVSANEWNKYIGKIVFTMENGKYTDFTWSCIPISDEIPDSDPMNELLNPFLEEAARRLSHVTAHTNAVLDGENRISRQKETPLGNLTADCMVWATRKNGIPCDFAFLNGGNIRASLPAGDITLADIATVLPFQNEVWILEVDGSTLREIFDFIAAVPPGSAGFPQMSHDVHYVLHPQEKKITGLTIHGEPLDFSRTYRFAVTDFIARGGDGYAILEKRKSAHNSSFYLPVIFAHYLETFSEPLPSEAEGRVQIVK